VRRIALVVAVLVLVSGCNGVLSGQGTATETVTPAPVPSPEPTVAGTDAGRCLVPPPAPRPGTPAPPPSTTQSLPIRNGTVVGADLVALHASVLPNYRYHLRIGDGYDVWSLANHSAFAYEGSDEGTRLRTIYAVGGTLSELDHNEDGPDVLRQRPYRAGDPGPGLLPLLTGSEWFENAIGYYGYELAGTREWNGTEVRVLRWRVDRPHLMGFKWLIEGNSTVYVDRRGIIRRVQHYERFVWVHPDEDPTKVNESELDVNEGAAQYVSYDFSVTELGTAPIPRPDAFCGRTGGDFVEWTPTLTKTTPPSDSE
jgi:hypothetical protein